MQSLRSIFISISGTEEQAVHDDCVPILLCVQTGTQSFRRHVFHWPVQMGTERTDCVSFRFSYHLFSRSIVWNGTVPFEASPYERNPLAFHFSEQ